MEIRKITFNNTRTKLIISLISICVIALIIEGYGSYSQSKLILSKKLTVTSTQSLSEINDGLHDYINVNTGDNYNYVPGMLKSVKESNKDILDTYYGTSSGKFSMYPSTPMPSGYDATSRSWYTQTLEHKGQIIITSPYKNVGTGNTVVGIAKTVEKNGQVIDVVGIDFKLTTPVQRMSTKKIGTTGYVFISDINCNIVSHPQKDLIGTNAASKLSIWNKANHETKDLFSIFIMGIKNLEYMQQIKLQVGN